MADKADGSVVLAQLDRICIYLIANDSLNLCHMVIIQRQSYLLEEGCSQYQLSFHGTSVRAGFKMIKYVEH